MQYDIFISYSRQDSPQVDSLISYLLREIPGIKIWYDREGIETAEEFHDKIVAAIDDSNVVVFVCSDNSIASKYCKKEVMYAKNIGKTVVPYLLPGMKLKGWLLFEFGNINCVSSTKEDEMSRMVRDIKLWTNLNNPLIQNDKDKVNETKPNSLEAQLEFDPHKGEFKQKFQPSNDITKECVTGYINGHEYVDLGLPSGLKWATCNVGASEPEKFGDYFAWGETKPKFSYDSDNSVTFPKGLSFTHRDNVFLDCHGNLKPSYDAATVQWGAPWRLPTLEEIDELVQNTVAEWKTLYSVKGLLVKSKINGKGIFLPAAGNRALTETYFLGKCGYYWSSTPSNVILNYRNSWGIYFSDGDCFNSLDETRYLGCPIRPVSN